MKIAAFTDFHGSHEAVEKARQAIAKEKPDLAIVAGDVVNHDMERAKRLLTKLAEAGIAVYFVPGNMDNGALKDWNGTGKVVALHGRCEYAADAALIGLGGSPKGAVSTPFELSEEEASEALVAAMSGYHGGPLILVSHSPPANTKIDQTSDGEHIGSRIVRQFIEANHPILVLSGHVHEGQGLDTIGTTMVVNTGPAKNGNFATITLDQKTNVNFKRFM